MQLSKAMLTFLGHWLTSFNYFQLQHNQLMANIYCIMHVLTSRYSHQVDPNAREMQGCTALHSACMPMTSCLRQYSQCPLADTDICCTVDLLVSVIQIMEEVLHCINNYEEVYSEAAYNQVQLPGWSNKEIYCSSLCCNERACECGWDAVLRAGSRCSQTRQREQLQHCMKQPEMVIPMNWHI